MDACKTGDVSMERSAGIELLYNCLFFLQSAREQPQTYKDNFI